LSDLSNPPSPADVEQLRAQVRELTEENELLLLQMHRLYGQLELPEQPQPELAAWVEQEAPQLAFLRRWWAEHQPEELVLDLREPVPGTNWHEAEADGRWAGPGATSSLRLPALRAGLYNVRIEVVDAMSHDILLGTTLTIDGAPLATETLFDGFPAVVLGNVELRGGDHATVELQLDFPRLMSPRERGEDDDRRLALRVRSVTFTRLEDL
jgi:hypothetical protein